MKGRVKIEHVPSESPINVQPCWLTKSFLISIMSGLYLIRKRALTVMLEGIFGFYDQPKIVLL